MFRANIEVTEKDMTWGQFKALCESNKLEITSLSLIDDQAAVVPNSTIDIPPNAACAIHFKSAEMQIPSGSASLVAESVGYIADGLESINRWSRNAGEVISSESTPKNAVHGIRILR